MPEPAVPRVSGIVLAAGAGTRYGGPKALAADAAGEPWLPRVCAALAAGGCGDVVVVLGAEAERAAALLPRGVRAVIARDWADGLSRSVAAGLAAAVGADAVLLAPVDVPDLPAAAVARVIAAADADPRNALVRAVYDGRPGHPVLIGATHLDAVRDGLHGDVGAGRYLSRHGAVALECGDLWDGRDVDAR
ncbi:NTP transferase domain-containing protein [Microbacterium sp. NPDC091313]